MTKTIPSEGLLKTCKRCGEAKPLHLFPKDYAPRKRDPDRPRYRPECKACLYAMHFVWRFNKRESMTPDEAAAYRKSESEAVLSGRRRMTPEQRVAWGKKTSATRRARYYRLKEAVYQAYGGGCTCCGETEPLFLSVDHVHGNGYDHRLMGKNCRGDMLYKWIIDNNFPADFQLLCMNCNWGRGRNNGICPHKTSNA
jgi:hypothetical protein